jgi:L-proline---[L-prolyl-carrier protein] ligase
LSIVAASLRQIIAERAARAPDSVAVQFRDQALSYRALELALTRLRARYGSVAGVRVVLLLPDSIEAYLLHLHLFIEGAVLVPLSAQSVPARVLQICERVAADLVVMTETLYLAHRAQLGTRRCALIKAYDATSGEIGQTWAGDAAQAFPVRAGEPVRYLMFTSGSTGTPKGVCLSEQSVLAAADMLVDFLPLDAATRSCVTVPLYDYYGMIQIYGHLLGGGAFCFGFHAGLANRLFQALETFPCSDLVLVPYTLRALLASDASILAPAFARISRLTSSSDALGEDLLAKLFAVAPHVTIVNVYGLTEIGRAVYRKINRDSPRSNSIGRASRGVEVEIQGDEQNPGEIVLRGPNLMLGYLQSADGEKLAFNPATEMRTGDLGYFNAQGEIMLLGRRDHMINLHGQKIHPGEIEAAALATAEVKEARAYVNKDAAGGASIVLEVVAPGGAVALEKVGELLRRRLPRAFVPTEIKLVPEIRRTEIGAKILR